MNLKKKINHLKACGLSGNFEEIERLYQGKTFDASDKTYKALLSLSKDLCDEYTSLCAKKDSSDRRNEILNILFPGHGVLYGVGAGINVVIGMVELGNNCYINTNVSFMPSSIITSLLTITSAHSQTSFPISIFDVLPLLLPLPKITFGAQIK